LKLGSRKAEKGGQRPNTKIPRRDSESVGRLNDESVQGKNRKGKDSEKGGKHLESTKQRKREPDSERKKALRGNAKREKKGKRSNGTKGTLAPDIFLAAGGTFREA